VGAVSDIWSKLDTDPDPADPDNPSSRVLFVEAYMRFHKAMTKVLLWHCCALRFTRAPTFA